MILNPSAIAVEHIRELIKQCAGHCPCIIPQTDDTICICKDMREKGVCHCGLYVEEKDGN